MYLCCNSGGEGGVVVHPSAPTPDRWQVSSSRAVVQKLKLRLGKHLTGAGLAVPFQGNADGEPLLPRQIPEESFAIQRADVTVVRRRPGDEVVEEKVSGHHDAGDAHQDERQQLEGPKAVHFFQDVLELHLHACLRLLRDIQTSFQVTLNPNMLKYNEREDVR